MDKLKSIGVQGWAIVVMGCVILVLLLFPKSCGRRNLEEKVERYEDYITQKQAEATVLRAEKWKLEKKLKGDSVSRAESERKYVAKITALEKDLAKKRRLADPIIQKNDTLIQWAQAVDSVHALQTRRISELQNELRIQGLIHRDLLTVQAKELTISNVITEDQSIIIESQKKQIRKLKFGRAVRNVLIPVVLIGGFILANLSQ